MTMTATTISSHDAVDQVLQSLANVVGLHVVELWTQNRNGFGLVQTYVVRAAFSPEQARVVECYHNGLMGDNGTSRNMCKRAMQSKHGFFWLAKSSQRLHQHLPIHTAVACHMPRDNINSDVFLVGFANSYMRYSQAKLDFMCLMSQVRNVTPAVAPLFISF